jgi:photosystem II stability/assembly factor-like uncharacterized protein
MKFKFTLLFLIFATSVFAQWTLTNYPPEYTPTTMLNVDGYFLVGTNLGIVCRTQDNGNSWDTLSNGLSGNLINDLLYDNTGGTALIYAATDSGIYRTNDYGNNWTALNNGIQDRYMNTVFKDGDLMLAGGSTANYRSTDSGNSWSALTIGSNPQPSTHSFINFQNAIFCAQSQPDGTPHAVFKSTDGGLTWTPSDSNLTTPATYDMAKLGSRLFLSSYNYVEYSTDGGHTWGYHVQGIPASFPNLEMESFGNILFIASHSGIYVLYDDSTTAVNINGNITLPLIYTLAVDQDFIVVGVFNFNPPNPSRWEVWIRPTLVTAIEPVGEVLPRGFALYQNYPNPFNPSTKIKFTIPNVGDANFASGTNVKLVVYDVLGNEVATLVNEEKTAGTYEINFNASGLTSGVYFYKLQAGSFVQTKKMILLR